MCGAAAMAGIIAGACPAAARPARKAQRCWPRSWLGSDRGSRLSDQDRACHARRMVSFLLTETMSRRHELSLQSYDRLFPSQDTLPRGGFGNLIALPFQRRPRQAGNSLFLDDALEPLGWEGQWRFLASAPRLPAQLVIDLAEEAARSNRVLGVRPPEYEDEELPGPARKSRDVVPGHIRGRNWPTGWWAGFGEIDDDFILGRDWAEIDGEDDGTE